MLFLDFLLDICDFAHVLVVQMTIATATWASISQVVSCVVLWFHILLATRRFLVRFVT